MHRVTTPLNAVSHLQVGDEVQISGAIYTARDAAHLRLVELLTKGKPLPLDLAGQIIYYVGPCPAKPGEVIGSAGPTTSGRMDSLTIPVLEAGLKGMIGKGERNQEVIEGIIKYQAVYFAALGGAGALLANAITKKELVAYPDLGPEAIYKLEVKDFPAIVAIDSKGRSIYQEGRRAYAKLGWK